MGCTVERRVLQIYGMERTVQTKRGLGDVLYRMPSFHQDKPILFNKQNFKRTEENGVRVRE